MRRCRKELVQIEKLVEILDNKQIKSKFDELKDDIGE